MQTGTNMEEVRNSIQRIVFLKMKALKTKTVDFTLEIKYNIPKNATPI